MTREEKGESEYKTKRCLLARGGRREGRWNHVVTLSLFSRSGETNRCVHCVLGTREGKKEVPSFQYKASPKKKKEGKGEKEDYGVPS